GQLDLPGRFQFLLLLGTGDLDQGPRPGTLGKPFQGRCNGGQGALVAGQQVPGRVRCGRVRTAGPGEVQQIAGLRVRRPRPGYALAAVDDEVQPQFAPVRIPVAYRVRASDRPLLTRQLLADALEIER